MISGAGLNLSREATLSTEWNISKLDYFLDLKSTIISAIAYTATTASKFNKVSTYHILPVKSPLKKDSTYTIWFQIVLQNQLE